MSDDAYQRLQREHAETEAQLTMLQNLYSASVQLLAAMRPVEVVRVVAEVLENLVGATVFSIFMWRQGERLGRPLHQHGTSDPARLAALNVHIEGALRLQSATTLRGVDGSFMLAVAPLYFGDELVGAAILEQLLPQKQQGLSETDTELLSLLSAQAAPALMRAQKYVEVEAHQAAVARLLTDAPASADQPSLLGNLDETKLVDVFQLVSMTKKSGRLSVTSGTTTIEFHFREGAASEVRRGAEVVPLAGAPTLLSEWVDRSGTFTFFAQSGAPPSPVACMGCDELVMEAFRLYDEGRAGARPSLPPPVPLDAAL